MPRSLPWFLVLMLVLAGLLGSLTPARAASRVSGPMVGHVTSSSALIWVYAGSRSRVVVQYRREVDPKGSGKSVPMPGYTAGPGTCRVKLTGLQPGTKYVYAAYVDGRYKPEWRGTFTTASVEGRPGRFRVAFTSCMKPDHPDHRTFGVLYRRKPDLFLLLGDNVYADTTNRGRLWEAHLAMRKAPPFARIIKNIPTLAVWDDHDFFNDNSDGTAPGKSQSLLAFQELFPNPSFGIPGIPGVFFSFRRADVDFFMLDVRYHRSPNKAPHGPQKTMLGEGQHRWLVEGLKRSRARFKVLVSGSTLAAKAGDSWKSFPHARRRLFGAIRDHGVQGVVFLSGDLHRSVIQVHPKAETGFYDLVEVISSGIAVGGPMNYAELDFDTTLADPTMTARVVERDGRIGKEQIVRLSSLR